MAIFVRGGDYIDFDPSKLRPREWAAVLSGDPGSKDGRTVYLGFTDGVVKRIATHEDMTDIILNATTGIREEFAQMFSEILEEMRNIKGEVEGYKTVVIQKTNEAQNSAESARDSSVTATTKAQEASAAADLSKQYSNECKMYSEKTKEFGDNAVDRINDALNIVSPKFVVDLPTGHLLYDGSWVDFFVINGHLEWSVIA